MGRDARPIMMMFNTWKAIYETRFQVGYVALADYVVYE